MKKLALGVAMLFLSTSAYASAVITKTIVPNDALKADNPDWQGTKYNGEMVILTNTLIGANIKYMKTITVHKGSAIEVQLIGDTKPKIQRGALVIIDLYVEGNIAYDNAKGALKAWNRKLPTAYDGLPVEFEDSGIKINNNFFLTASPVKSVQGIAPNFNPASFQIKLSMPLEVYERDFEPGLLTFAKEKSRYPITGQGKTGTLIQYLVTE